MSLSVEEEVKVLELSAVSGELIGNARRHIAARVSDVNMHGIHRPVVCSGLFCQVEREHEIWDLRIHRFGQSQLTAAGRNKPVYRNNSILSCIVIDVNFQSPLSGDLLDTIHTSKVADAALNGSHSFANPFAMWHLGNRSKQKCARSQLANARIRWLIGPVAVVEVRIAGPHAFVEQSRRKRYEHRSFH